jgi:hypothetical protein
VEEGKGTNPVGSRERSERCMRVASSEQQRLPRERGRRRGGGARGGKWMGEQVRGEPTRETECRTPEPLRAKMKRVFGFEPTHMLHRLRAVLRERAATRRHACG